ncbi:MAG: DUF2848 domain-containing protein [Gammaproteobacteria bacterium]|nr:DUF2848 domain-containing protein [Gammaproteobacteria bacterium]MDH3466388.1 DUF2848 domain-containing protein [Gammaproteobacteria bacterium]
MTHDILLPFHTHSQDGVGTASLTLSDAVIAGWTGRDTAAMERHIVELEALGVTRPAATPIFYRTSVARITLANCIEVSGEDSSGEVEFVLIQHGSELWVGVGSDHTDRKVETYNVTVSKQMCDKPMAPVLWPYQEVQAHWDSLIVRSFAVENGERNLYQEGPVASMLAPATLIQKYTDGRDRLPNGTAMFGGTLPARGGVRAAVRFEFELEDPVLGRHIAHGYDVLPLPDHG